MGLGFGLGSGLGLGPGSGFGLEGDLLLQVDVGDPLALGLQRVAGSRLGLGLGLGLRLLRSTRGLGLRVGLGLARWRLRSAVGSRWTGASPRASWPLEPGRRRCRCRGWATGGAPDLLDVLLHGELAVELS